MIEDDGWITLHPKLKDGLSDKVSAELHRAYDEITKEPIPEDMTRLLDDLG